VHETLVSIGEKMTIIYKRIYEITALTALLSCTALLLPSTVFAAELAEVGIVSPTQHNSANTYIFISFVVKNQNRVTDTSKTEFAVTVNDGRYFVPRTLAPSMCSSTSAGQPTGTYAETCGCYFDLRQVDTNRSLTNIAVHYQNTDAGVNLDSRGYSELLPSSGPVMPAPTSPMCPTDIRQNALQPFPIVDREVVVTAPGMFTLDGSAAYDPYGGALTYSWHQVSGPNVAINNANSATPSFGLTNISTPTELKFQMHVASPSGYGAAERVTVTAMPASNTSSCSPWNRDHVVDSLTAIPQTGSGTNYSLRHLITGQIGNDLQAEAQRLSTIYANFKRLEIKSYISSAGTGAQPIMGGGQVPGAPSKVKHFEHPVSPVPTLYWMGDPFAQDTWYRLSTKLNVYDTNNNFIDSSTTYEDSCLYETVYVKLDSGGNFNPSLRAAGPNFIISDGTSTLKSETVSANSSGGAGGGSQVVLAGTGIRVEVPTAIAGTDQLREIVVSEEDVKKVKKKVKKRWQFWKRHKE